MIPGVAFRTAFDFADGESGRLVRVKILPVPMRDVEAGGALPGGRVGGQCFVVPRGVVARDAGFIRADIGHFDDEQAALVARRDAA